MSNAPRKEIGSKVHKLPLREHPRAKLMERPVETDDPVMQWPIPTKNSLNPRRKKNLPLNRPCVAKREREAAVEAR